MLKVTHRSADDHLGHVLMLSPDSPMVCTMCLDLIGQDEDYRVDMYEDSYYMSYHCEACMHATVPDGASVEWDG
jgi:hypothetical protein